MFVCWWVDLLTAILGTILLKIQTFAPGYSVLIGLMRVKAGHSNTVDISVFHLQTTFIGGSACDQIKELFRSLCVCVCVYLVLFRPVGARLNVIEIYCFDCIDVSLFYFQHSSRINISVAWW